MKPLEPKINVEKTIRNFDTLEENSIQGSPRRSELFVRARFMKKKAWE